MLQTAVGSVSDISQFVCLLQYFANVTPVLCLLSFIQGFPQLAFRPTVYYRIRHMWADFFSLKWKFKEVLRIGMNINFLYKINFTFSHMQYIYEKILWLWKVSILRFWCIYTLVAPLRKKNGFWNVFCLSVCMYVCFCGTWVVGWI